MRLACLVFMCALRLAAKREDSWPENLEDSQRAGCRAQQVFVLGQGAWWQTHVWIDFPDERISRLYSIRDGKERSKALKDCDYFMKEWEKLRAKRLKQRAHGLQ